MTKITIYQKLFNCTDCGDFISLIILYIHIIPVLIYVYHWHHSMQSNMWTAHQHINGYVEIVLAFLSYFLFMVEIFSLTSCQNVPCWHTLMVCLLFFNTLGEMIIIAIFLYWPAISVISAHKVAGDEVSFSPISRIRSCIVSLLNFGLASLNLLLVKDRSDKPCKPWRILFVVRKTGNKSMSV